MSKRGRMKKTFKRWWHSKISPEQQLAVGLLTLTATLSVVTWKLGVLVGLVVLGSAWAGGLVVRSVDRWTVRRGDPLELDGSSEDE